jgi:enoyl-CoA hydratase/carnithine racemase
MLLTARDNAVLRITLNRPAKRNALHPDLIQDLSEVLTAADNDSSLNVLVITGAGTTFCSGLDLVQLSSLAADERVQYMRTFFSLLRQIYRLRQPVIAAVNGPAIAGGFDLAAFCDLRLCSTTATFAQTEMLLGITQIIHPLYRVIGLGRAMELALTAMPIDANEAYRVGLANRICRPEELLDEAIRLAATLAARPRMALLETKRLTREVIDLDTETAMKQMFGAISERLKSEEHVRAIHDYIAGLKQQS